MDLFLKTGKKYKESEEVPSISTVFYAVSQYHETNDKNVKNDSLIEQIY